MYLLSSLVFLLWLGTFEVQAQEPAAFTSRAEYAFGQVMTFYLSAEVAEGVEHATLLFRAPEFDNTYVKERPITDTDYEANGFQIFEDVSLSEVRLAPFTVVTYWWQLQLTNGQQITLPEQTIQYVDDQFEWHNLAQEPVTVYWTGEDAVLGQIALDVVTEATPRLADFLPTAVTAPLSIYIYPTSADLRAALRLTGRDWVGAHTAPELGVILVTAVNIRTAATDLSQSIPHEMTHFLLYQSDPAHYDAVPAWLNEGLATLAEAAARPTYKSVLATAVSNQTTLPFTDLCTAFPAREEQVLLAYAQSSAFVQYLQARYGTQALRELIAAYFDGADCESGISRTLQTTLPQLNEDWLRSQQPQTPLAQFFLNNTLWLLLILGGFGITSLLVLTKGE